MAALRTHLLAGQVIPAHPLALDARRRLDERHQRGLTRYYLAAGAGGVAVGVHTTQFAIREPRHGLLRPVLELAAHTADEALAARDRPFARVAGVCGPPGQALQEAALARELGYHTALVSLAGWDDADDAALLHHCRAVAEVLPVFGFYLQPAVGGRVLGYDFWRAFLEIERVVAIKVAPFDRYRTLDVIRAAAQSGRRDVALYTGNDDSIVADLLTRYESAGHLVRMAGGLLGQWAVWTRNAVQLLQDIHRAHAGAPDAGADAPRLLALGAQLTEANGAIFDVQHGFAGCIAGIHEVLRRQGLMAGAWCLDPAETLSPGQYEAIDRVLGAYPHLADDAFVREHLAEWLAD